MKSIKGKFTSRKFLLAAAAFIAGIAGVIAGINTDNQALLVIGAVCTALSAFIYEIVEVFYDVTAAEETTVVEEVEFEDDDTDDGDFEYEDVE